MLMTGFAAYQPLGDVESAELFANTTLRTESHQYIHINVKIQRSWLPYHECFSEVTSKLNEIYERVDEQLDEETLEFSN